MALLPSKNTSSSNSDQQREASRRVKQSTGRKPKGVGDVRPWQLILGGISLTGGSMVAGAKISELILAFLMPGLLH